MFEDRPDQFFNLALFQTIGRDVQVGGYQSVAGGCINNGVKLDTQDGSFFLKWNTGSESDMFEREAQGIEMLAKTKAIRVPEVLGYGQADGKNYLILQYVAAYNRSAHYWAELGQQLAALHEHSSNFFGLEYDNYIGRLPQRNTTEDNWIDFFIEHRLEVQLGLAIYNNQIDKQFAKRFRHIYSMLPGELPEEQPALLHGDLWSGNVIVGDEGRPYLIDPAVYFGHREAEIAFTTLFGGFDHDFYQAYSNVYPLEPGFDHRKDLYNLYPLLVHVNLFGSAYISGIERTLRNFL